MKRKNAALISGAIWMIVGIRLLYVGLHRVEEVALIGLGLLIGYLKGHFALRKGARRVMARLRAQEEPLRWMQMYSKGYWALLFGMGCLGMLLRFIPGIPLEVRGVVSIAIGAALLQGSTIYFREAHALGS
ncbi:MAG: hypothetical protein KBC64_00945 [Simkaniaceae bacterium]|nr:hypothetical protein [Simkaniaceae bacterium]